MEPRIPKPWLLRFCVTVIWLVLGLFASAQADTPTTAEASPDIPKTLIYGLIAMAVVQVTFIVSLSSILRTLGSPGAWKAKTRSSVERALVLIPLILLGTSEADAQAYKGDGGTISTNHLFWVLVATNIFFFLVLLVQLNLLRGLTKTMTGVEDRPLPVRSGPSWEQRFLRKLTRQVSVEKEQDILMHHEYDGIRELDNVLPPWWVWMFYGTIIWSLVYLVNVHVIKIWPDQKTEYVSEMAQADTDIAAYKATLGSIVDENTVTLSTDAGVLSSGKAIFTQYCTPCHGPDAAGSETSVGPNLTDPYWLHGGGVKNVFKTISYGVPSKGMISWKSQLKPTEIAAVANYILSLQGTGPAAQKAPQGELWNEVAPADSSAVLTDSLASPKDTARLAAK